MSLLTCNDVAFSYDGKDVISNINFNVEQGDYLCIVGENGAGKSTLIKGLLNLKKPSAGKIMTGDGLKANEIGYLPQQTQIQKDFPASVSEVVLSGCLNSLGLRLFYNRRDRQNADNQMKKLGIYELKNRCYRELSGGQQQRVLLARALCATKKILLLDEPISGLDPYMTEEFYSIVKELNRTDGITVIMVSHDIRGILSSATHILSMEHGSVFFGTKEEYCESDAGRYFMRGEGNDAE